MSRGRTHVAGALAAVLLAVAVSGCATSRHLPAWRAVARAGDWDTAVAYFTKALQDDPDRPDYKISLERAMTGGVNAHLDGARARSQGRSRERAGRVPARCSSSSPATRTRSRGAANSNGSCARRPTPRARRRGSTPCASGPAARRKAPILNPTSKEPLSLNFATNTAIQDILKFIGDVTGINVIIEQGASRSSPGRPRSTSPVSPWNRR